MGNLISWTQNRRFLFKFLFYLIVVLGSLQVLVGQITDMCPKMNECSIDLFDIGKLFLSWKVCWGASLVAIQVDLIFKLILNMNPEHFQQILWISLFVKETILVQISILHQCLTSVNFSLIVGTFHEDTEEGFRRRKAEYLAKVAFFIVDPCSIDLIEGFNNFWYCNTKIPNYFGRALSFIIEPIGKNINDFEDKVSNILLR